MSTDRREIEALVMALKSFGATVAITEDDDGHVDTIRVTGCKGFGPHAMSPLSFAEAARAVVTARIPHEVVTKPDGKYGLRRKGSKSTESYGTFDSRSDAWVSSAATVYTGHPGH